MIAIEHNLSVTPLDDIISEVRLERSYTATDRGTMKEVIPVFNERQIRIDPLLEDDDLSMIRREGRALIETEHIDVFVELHPVEFLPDGTLLVDASLNY